MIQQDFLNFFKSFGVENTLLEAFLQAVRSFLRGGAIFPLGV